MREARFAFQDVRPNTAHVFLGSNQGWLEPTPGPAGAPCNFTSEKCFANATGRPRPDLAMAKRKPNAAFMKPVQPDAVLAAVVGSKPLPRTELTKKLWDYIKKNGLQDKKVKTQINADAALAAVFGGKKSVSMFEMTKLVSGHVKS
jgi:chromatin remodeling complex protein RSC6